MKPSFTLVTPSLNQADYIERCARSVLDQVGAGEIDLDYTIADAGSRDGSVERVRQRVAGADSARIVVEPDAGAADAIARELGGARGDFVGWLNADDVLLPGALRRIAAEFDRGDADVVYADGWFIDTRDRVVGAYPTVAHDPGFLRTFCYLSQPSVFVRRSAYEAVGGVDAGLDYCFDYELWMRLAKAGCRFRHLHAFCSATRLHEKTKTARRALDFTDEIIEVQQRLHGDVPDAWRVYRDFRTRQIERPDRARLLAFSAALVRALRTRRGRGAVSVWSMRVARAHLRAALRALPARVTRRSLAP